MADHNQTAASPVVAALGLGAMGLPMASRLATTLVVRAFDVLADRVDLAAGAGATPALTPAHACRDADVVVVAVRNQEQFDEVMFGPDGAVETLRRGAVVVLASTVGTDAAAAAARRLAEHDVDLLDAPVSGGPIRAAAGELLIMVGADDDVVARGRPVLDLLATTVHVVGARAGDGQTMKTVNQLLCGIHTAAAGEALALAHKLGLALETVIDVLGAGAAASFMLADRGPRMAQQLTAGRCPELRSRLDVISKDMGIVHRLCRSAGVWTPLAMAAEQTYLLGEALGLAAEDDSIVAVMAQPAATVNAHGAVSPAKDREPAR